VEIYHQTMISPRDQFLINCSMLLDDSKTITQCGLSPYSIFHLHIRFRGVCQSIWIYLLNLILMISVPTRMDYHFPTQHRYWLMLILEVILDILCPLSHGISVMWLPQWRMSDIYDYRGIHVSTSPPRSVISYHVDLTSNPGPNDEC